MVYMSGSRAARNQSSIVNRTNVCGGVKKGGLAPSIGWFMSSNPTLNRAPHSLPITCVASTTIQTQRRRGYVATLGK